MDIAAVRSLAKRMGFDMLDERQLQELAAALESGEALAARLPRDLHWSEECAHLFRLAPRRSVRP